MALLPAYLRRSTAILKMPAALAKGLTPTAFLRKLRITSGGYRRQRFLDDWRSVAGIEKKKDAFKYIRRDRIPPMASMATVKWDLSQEYMYRARTWSRLKPGLPLREDMSTIMSDNPMTQAQVESELFRRWKEHEDEEDYPYKLERVQVLAGYRRDPEWFADLDSD